MTEVEPGGAPLPEFDPAKLVEIDVRETIGRGEEPLQQILQAADGLPAGGVLHIRSPFKPAPLFAVLADRGFAHHTVNFGAKDWSSWFWRPAAPPPPPVPAAHQAAPDGPVLDLRRLPPPEPINVILERVERTGIPFDVMLPFYPGPLIPLLEAGGWTARQLEARGDGVIMRIEPGDGKVRRET
jgi:hypothetical protein